ncbi:DUF1348 family protein [Acetobacter thailandicus]|nr:DUF1348 family protein [Acetobacter thailandicus]
MLNLCLLSVVISCQRRSGHRENRISVRFAYEWHDEEERCFRFYGNEK